MYHSIRRGLKRKEPGQDPELGDYQAGVNQFQAAVRKRESMRLKLQMNSAPGILEKELMNKINVKEPLTTAMLTAAPMQEQKQMLGERLFPLIQVKNSNVDF